MTNAEAKGRIKSLLSYMESLDADEEEERDIEALRMAIEALSAPTIPLSVIEKIHDAVDNADSDDFYEDEHGYIIDSMLTVEHIHEIIDKAVKECTHEKD